jgi:hypothetical protein
MMAEPTPAAAVTGAPGRYTFHFDRVPFWTALDEICGQCGLMVQHGNWGDDTLRVESAASYVPFCSIHGPFKIIANGFTYSRSSQLGQVPKTLQQPHGSSYEYLSLGLTIQTEPRLPILKMGQAQITFAVDEEDHPMLATNDQVYQKGGMWRAGYSWWGRSSVCMTQVNLSWPDKHCRIVQTLRGYVPVTLLAEQKAAVVTDQLQAAKGKEFKVGGLTFKVDDFTALAGNRQHQIKLSFSEDQAGTADPTTFQTLQQRLEIQDAKGNKLPFYFNNLNFNGNGSGQLWFTTQMSDPKSGVPARLIYFTWSLIDHEVAFEFKGLPLP